MLTFLLLACGLVAAGPRDLAPFVGGTITLVDDGVRLDAPAGCPTIGPRVTGTLNGAPLTIHQPGGKRWGSSPDGLTPMRVCDGALLVAGRKPAGRATIELTDGTVRWTMVVEDVGQPKTMTYAGDLPSGGTVRLVTTPASARWSLPLERHQGTYASIQPVGPTFTDDLRTCIVSWGAAGERPGQNAYGSMTAGAAAQPGQVELALPVVPCADPAEIRYDGAVDLAISACPAGMECRAWEEADARISGLRWTR